MDELKLKKPMLVARNSAVFVIAESDFRANPMTDAQVWRVDGGYSEVQPLQVHLKFTYYLQDVIPPEPWSEPA